MVESYFDASIIIEKLLINEDGHRGIKNGVKSLYTRDVEGQLCDAAVAICSKNCKSIGILVGSTTNMIMWPPTDTDGPGGCFALAYTLLQLDKTVYILTDETNEDQVLPALEKSDAFKYNERKLLDKLFVTVLAGESSTANVEKNASIMADVFAQLDHIINVGRPGPAVDGHYYSFDKRIMTHYQPNFSKLFEMSEQSRGTNSHVLTTCIGELGNELGMGLVSTSVIDNVPDGKLIHCPISSDNLIISTCVNWGAFGLCAMIGIISVVESKQEQMLVDDLYPTRQDQSAVLRCLVEEASRCGVTGTRDLIIDNYPEAKCHSIMENIRNEARELALQLYNPKNNIVFNQNNNNNSNNTNNIHYNDNINNHINNTNNNAKVISEKQSSTPVENMQGS